MPTGCTGYRPQGTGEVGIGSGVTRGRRKEENRDPVLTNANDRLYRYDSIKGNERKKNKTLG